MKSRQIPVLPILCMVAIVAGAYGLYKTLEFEEESYFVSQSSEARKNPFLAASRLLERHGFETTLAENRGVLTQLDIDKTGVLLLADLNDLEDPREAETILEWINAGGILLSSPNDYSVFEYVSVASDFLQKLGVESLAEYDLSDDQSEYNDDDPIYRISLDDKDIAEELVLFTSNTPYFINSSTDQHSLTTLIDSPALIHKSLGQGYFSLYSDPALFNNLQLENVDHAYALLWLTQPAKTKSMTVVYRPAGKPGFFKFVWNKFTASLLLAGLVLAGYLRWASARLGPVEQELPPMSNNLMAHLEARGEYWYRHKYTSDVVANVQQSALENLAIKQGKLRDRHSVGDADREQMIKHASKLLKCSKAEAEKVLFAQTTGDASILSTSRALQKINHQKLFNQKNLTE